MKPGFLTSLLLLLSPCLPAADWSMVSVPGTRDAGERAAVSAAGSHAWYRTWVKVDPSFFTRHERNLFEESVGIHVRDLAGAHDLWVNGVRIGTGGSMPPA